MYRKSDPSDSSSVIEVLTDESILPKTKNRPKLTYLRRQKIQYFCSNAEEYLPHLGDPGGLPWLRGLMIFLDCEHVDEKVIRDWIKNVQLFPIKMEESYQITTRLQSRLHGEMTINSNDNKEWQDFFKNDRCTPRLVELYGESYTKSALSRSKRMSDKEKRRSASENRWCDIPHRNSQPHVVITRDDVNACNNIERLIQPIVVITLDDVNACKVERENITVNLESSDEESFVGFNIQPLVPDKAETNPSPIWPTKAEEVVSSIADLLEKATEETFGENMKTLLKKYDLHSDMNTLSEILGCCGDEENCSPLPPKLEPQETMETETEYSHLDDISLDSIGPPILEKYDCPSDLFDLKDKSDVLAATFWKFEDLYTYVGSRLKEIKEENEQMILQVPRQNKVPLVTE